MVWNEIKIVHKQKGKDFGTRWLRPTLNYDSTICLGDEKTKIDLNLDSR
jgi:hypothetical protein